MSAAKTPTVAIAQVLRGLGLKQGEDFRVTGFYRSGERIGTYVIVFNKATDETIAANADEVVRLTGEAGFAFRVSIRYHRGRPFVDVKNFGPEVREDAPADETAPSINEDPRVTELADDTAPAAAEVTECSCDPAPYRETDGTYSHWADCAVAAAQQAAAELTGAERANDLGHLVGQTFTRMVPDYQADGWPQIERTAEVLEVLADYVADGRSPAPNVGIRFRLRDVHRPQGVDQFMTLADFIRRWMDEPQEAA